MIWSVKSSTVELLKHRHKVITALLRRQKSEIPMAKFLVEIKDRHRDRSFFSASSLQLVS
jgi:hypothetical protein